MLAILAIWWAYPLIIPYWALLHYTTTFLAKYGKTLRLHLLNAVNTLALEITISSSFVGMKKHCGDDL